MYRGIFFDLSGVLYTGQQPISGALEAIRRVQASDLQVRFVTNTSRRSHQQLRSDLARLGFDIEDHTMFSAPVAAKSWILEHHLRPYCLLHQDLRCDFDDIEQQPPNAVLVGDAADNFTYASLNRAFQLCQAGAPLIAMGMNRFFKLDGQLQLDAGPFIKALEFASDCQAQIIGKPETAFFQQVIASTTLTASDILMVGDDVFGDIEGAARAGMAGCLVKTGKYQAGDENLITAPMTCVDSVADAVELVLGS